MFDCHINIEVCASVRCVKYIHKYIFKGYDKTTIVLMGLDEIQIYINSRYIGPVEAAWRLLGFSMHQEVPNVVRLTVHLPGYHRVIFNPKESLSVVMERAKHQRSTLTAFLEYCATNIDARQYTYQQFPEHFCWDKANKCWKKRARGFAIGIMYFCRPNAREQFYLRLLLTIVKGPVSFEDLRTVNGKLYPTFKEACVAHGLLEDDREWAECLKEASIIKTGHQLRRLFVVILLECNPTGPNQLWEEFKEHICDDLKYKLQNMFHIDSPTEEEVYDYGLHLINKMLFETGKTIADFSAMPTPVRNWELQPGNQYIWEHQQHRHQQYNQEYLANISRLNEEQRDVYNVVVNFVAKRDGQLFFLNGPAGTGKTFVYNTIAAKCRHEEDIVLMVASSGIASLLLCGERTTHSTFSIPFDILDDSQCGISKQSPKADLLRKTKLIIWDEVPMQHKFCIEAVDHCLRDICNNENPFGGISVVLGGDFRQCLPVVPKGTREQIVNASIRKSYLWTNVHILTLVKNMRFENSPENIHFGAELNKIGSSPEESVELPKGIKRCANMGDLIKETYPGLENAQCSTTAFLNERIILSPRNDDVDYINFAALEKYPGDMITKLGADNIPDMDPGNPMEINRFPSEYVNNIQPAGLPPFTLQLKKGCPIMLLRNIAPTDGMCNGTRLRVEEVKDHCIYATILTGEKAGEQVFIPRISLTPSSKETPVQFTRRQFPVRLAYAMTINKSQGQSVKYVGIDLQNDVFSHGQLYVALSRCTSAKRIKCCLPTTELTETTNIVFPEVLL